jgi:hypothetical protein
VIRALAVLAVALSTPAAAQVDAPRYHARQDVMIAWAPRYVLDTTMGPLGLEQQLWRRVDMLPLYHRVSLDATNVEGHVDLHFAGWGALDLMLDSDGGVGAGDVAIAYGEVSFEPVRLWAGRRFVTFGPPGGLHVDGGGASVRASFGLIAEAFAGRPVTPRFGALIGPQPSFDGAAIAYGARIAYADAGRLGASASYAELFSHGMVGVRVVDVAAYGAIDDVRIEGAAKVDVREPGVMLARANVDWRVMRELSLDAQYQHLEPARWIAPWSLLSVFETSAFDEAAVGGTVRPLRAVSIRAELAGRMYAATGQSDVSLGYRAELSARVLPGPSGVRLHTMISRRDDGVVGFTVVTAGVAFDPIALVTLAIDGAYAIDDRAVRESAIGRLTVDVDVGRGWSLGGTISAASTPIAPAETRGMLRASWAPAVTR